MSDAFITSGTDEKCIELSRNTKRRDCMIDLRGDERIILKWLLKK